MDEVAVAPARAFGERDRLLGPYVPTLVVDWLRERPQERYRAIDCTLVFADVSGFTRMTEMLADRGKAGAEEMAGVINSTFEALLREAYSYGAGLIKWGGDAALLFFDGPGHAARAGRAAYEMQEVMRRVGQITTSRGSLRLRMSIGINSGAADFFLVGHDDHRELLLLGPVVSVLTEMEKVAEAGQMVVAEATATALEEAGERRPSVAAGAGWLLRRPPAAEALPPGSETVDYRDVEIEIALAPTLREHILAGGLEYEHRHASIGFLKFTDTDRLLAAQGPEAVLTAVDHVIRSLQSAALANEVTFLMTDIGADCGKVMLSAGAPRRIGRDETRIAATLRAAIDAGGVLPVSAGATAGRAFAGDYGPPHRRTYSLMGDCVNTAARLMARAGDGELLANEALIAALAGSFTATAGEPFAAKGKRAPLVPFLIGAASASRTGPASVALPLIGREPELSTLLAAAELAVGGAGSAIEVVGPPGIGKSRLLDELEARALTNVLWTESDVYEATRPYAPFERLLRIACDLPADAPTDVAAARLTDVVRERTPELVCWLPLIGIAAGLELLSTLEVDETDPGLRKQRLEEATSELLGRLLDEPTALIFSRAQLMDEASRDLVRRLARDAGSRRWLVIISRRPERGSPLEDIEATRIELGPLSDAAAAELLAEATRATPLPPHRLLTLAERAAGNPLFLTELGKQLSEGGDPDAIPASVEDAIAARIDRLDAVHRRTLRAAAVIGVEVELALLDEVLANEVESPAALREIVDGLTELLEPAGPARLRFTHQLIREVAYEALPYGRRTELHERTAAAIRASAAGQEEQHAELLSVHLFHGGDYADAWTYSGIAANRARTRYSNAEAAQSYGRALAAAAHLPELGAQELAAVDIALGDIYVDLGELREAEVVLRRGLRRMRDVPVRAAVLQLRIARLRDIAGQHSTAMRWAMRAERSLGGQDGAEARLIRARLATRRARISYRLGHHHRARAYAGAAIELAREIGDRRTLAEALEYSDLSGVELGLPVGDGARQALAIYEELGALADEANMRNTLGMLAYHRGAWPEALLDYRASEDTFHRAGKHWDAATAAANAAEILVDQGRFQEAQTALGRAILAWRGANAASEVAFGDYQLGRIAARLGDSREAQARLEAARGHFVVVGEQTEVVVVDALLAESRWLAGEFAEALALADATLARVASQKGVASVVPLLHRVRGGALLATGRREDAEHALRASLDAARNRGAMHEVAYTLSALLGAAFAADALEEGAWRRELEGWRSALELAL